MVVMDWEDGNVSVGLMEWAKLARYPLEFLFLAHIPPS
jgi:hypothetical protein